MTSSEKKKAMQMAFVCRADEHLSAFPEAMRNVVFASQQVKEAASKLEYVERLPYGFAFNCEVHAGLRTAWSASESGSFTSYSRQTAGLERVDHQFTEAQNRAASESVDVDGHSFANKVDIWETFWANTQASLNGALEALPPGVERTLTVIAAGNVEMVDATVNAICAVGQDLGDPAGEHACAAVPVRCPRRVSSVSTTWTTNFEGTRRRARRC
jgi:hypothetical protein